MKCARLQGPIVVEDENVFDTFFTDFSSSAYPPTNQDHARRTETQCRQRAQGRSFSYTLFADKTSKCEIYQKQVDDIDHLNMIPNKETSTFFCQT